MNRFFIATFTVLAVICILAAAIKGRLDFLPWAAACGLLVTAGRAEQKKQEER